MAGELETSIPISVITLIDESQNSISPNTRTPLVRKSGPNSSPLASHSQEIDKQN
jgi:hypothetical protein